METGVLVLSNVMILLIIVMAVASERKRAAAFLRKLFKKRRAQTVMNAAMISEFTDKNILVRDAVNGNQFEGKLVRVEDNWIQIDRQTKKGVISRLINLDSVASIEIRN